MLRWKSSLKPAAAAAADYRSTILADSPVAYWRLGEASGSTASDEVGSSDGTYGGDVTLGVTGALSGDSNTSISLAGSSTQYDGVTVSSLATASYSSGITIELWVYWDSSTSAGMPIEAREGTDGNDRIFFDARSGTPHWDFNIAGTWYTAVGAGIQDGWHLYAFTHDGTNAKTYRDGVLQNTQSASAATFAPTSMGIGQDGNGFNVFTGGIDEVAIYNTALSATELLAHYTAGTSGGESYVLDDLSVGVDFAFSVSRYLSSTYVGSSVVKLREDNGDTTSDFKIVNGALVTNDANEYTVATWLSNASATNAYVQTWYDQSGNGNDIQQLTNSYQPTYAASWTNGRASVNNPSGQHFLTTVSSFTASNTAGVSCYVACEEVNSGVIGGIFGDPNSSTFGLNFNVQKPLYVADFGVQVLTTNDVSRDPHVISYEGDAGTGAVPVTIRVDSVQDASASMAHDQRSGNWVMFNSRSSNFSSANLFVGYIGELIYAKSEFSTSDRDVVEDSLKDWFGI